MSGVLGVQAMSSTCAVARSIARRADYDSSVAESEFPFVDVVVADRDLVVTNSHEHACRLEPRESELAWHCDLDDGTSSSGESDPATYIRWVCPPLRILGTATPTPGSLLDVSRPGPHSDLGKLFKALGRLTRRASETEPGGGAEGRFAYHDPAGILDADLRRRIEHWPPALHGDGGVRPAELWAIRITREGLVVDSASWWNSAPALEHQIDLALDIARRLTAQR